MRSSCLHTRVIRRRKSAINHARSSYFIATVGSSANKTQNDDVGETVFAVTRRSAVIHSGTADWRGHCISDQHRVLYTSLFTIMVAENKKSKRLNKLQQCEAKQLN